MADDATMRSFIGYGERAVVCLALYAEVLRRVIIDAHYLFAGLNGGLRGYLQECLHNEWNVKQNYV